MLMCSITLQKWAKGLTASSCRCWIPKTFVTCWLRQVVSAVVPGSL